MGGTQDSKWIVLFFFSQNPSLAIRDPKDNDMIMILDEKDGIWPDVVAGHRCVFSFVVVVVFLILFVSLLVTWLCRRSKCGMKMIILLALHK